VVDKRLVLVVLIALFVITSVLAIFLVDSTFDDVDLDEVMSQEFEISTGVEDDSNVVDSEVIDGSDTSLSSNKTFIETVVDFVQGVFGGGSSTQDSTEEIGTEADPTKSGTGSGSGTDLGVLADVTDVILNSSSGTNTTDENLTAHYTLSNSSDKAIINWYQDGSSITTINMPFEGLTSDHVAVTDEVVVYYLEGNANDETTNNNDGTLSGLSLTSDGKINQAYNFSGNDNEINLGSFDMTGFSGFSISMWLYSDDFNSSNEFLFSSKYNDNDDIRIATKATVFDDTDTPTVYYTLNDDAWNHFVITQSNNDNTLKAYINGVLVDNTTETFDYAGLDGLTYIGERVLYSGQSDFHGIMDEIHIWDRDINLSEIQTIYNTTRWGHTAKDYSDYNNEGVEFDGPTWSSTSGYDGNGAYTFDGSNYLLIDDAGSNDELDMTNAITVAAWIYPTADVAGARILMKPWATNVAPWKIYEMQRQDDSSVYFGVANTSSSGTSVGATGSAPLNTWTYVVGTYDGSELRIYINGVLNNTNAFSGSMYQNDRNVYVGYNPNYNPQSFEGKIDEVMVLDRVLSAEQILAYYNNQTDLIVSQETLVSEVWNATVTPNNGSEDGTTVWSNSLTVLASLTPFVSGVILNSSSGTNLTSENLSVSYTLDGSADRAIINWYKNGSSLAVINLGFEADGNQNATDYSGNSHNGTVNGNPVWGSSSGYGSTGAYAFDGVGDFISSSDSADFTLGTDYTVEAWINNDPFVGNWAGILGTYNNPDGFILGLSNYAPFSSGVPNELVFFAAGTWTQSDFSIPQDGKWKHVVYTRSESVGKFYVNGTLVKSVTAVAGNDGGDFHVGDGGTGWSTEEFNGTIDNVKIYNGLALSPEQILAHYNNRTDLIVSQETVDDDVWNATVTPNDGSADGPAVWSNSLTISSGGGSYGDCPDNSGNWIISSAETIVDDVHCNVIEINGSGTLTVNSSTKGSQILINTTNLTIDAGGIITANYKGYARSEGPGQGVDGDSFDGAGGGSYGGYAGDGNSGYLGGEPYGNQWAPTQFGSGGGNAASQNGGAGGGAIKIIVSDTFELNGIISVNGGPGISGHTNYASGGGAGGAIFINTSTWKGIGYSTAIGGAGADRVPNGGGGSGGRIALYYDTKENVNVSAWSVAGGTINGGYEGDPGTIGFIEKGTDDIIINGGWEFGTEDSYNSLSTYNAWFKFNETSELNITTFINLGGESSFTCFNSGKDLTLNIVNDLNLSNSNFKDVGNDAYDFSNVYINFENTLLSNEIFNIEATDLAVLNKTTSRNSVNIDNLNVYSQSNLSLDFTEDSLTFNNSIVSVLNTQFTDIVNTVTLILQNSSIKSSVDWTITNLTIDANSLINADYRGYAQSDGPGTGEDGVINYGAGAGSYGGYGGDGDDSIGQAKGGVPYGDVFYPTQFGSGGGECGDVQCNGLGGRGGGLIKFIVTNLEFNGTISANGEGGVGGGLGDYAGGGGAGGAIFVNVTSLSGTGKFTADGGDGVSHNEEDGGGGSGGRIAIYYNTIEGINYTESSVTGGSGTYATPGRSETGDPGTLAFIDVNDNLLTIYEGWEWQSDKTLVNITDYGSLIRLNTTVKVSAENIFNKGSSNYTCYNNTYDLTLDITNDLNISSDGFREAGLEGQLCSDVVLNFGRDLYSESQSYVDAVDSIYVNNTNPASSETYTNLNIAAGNNITYHLTDSDLTLDDSSLSVERAQWTTLISTSNFNLQNSTITSNIDWSFTNLTIDSSSSIDSNSLGYAPSEGTGAGTDCSVTNAAGGSYGGLGGAGDDSAGNPYGSLLNSNQFGSGGGSCGTDGGLGGGSIYLSISDTFDFDGEITSNGGNGQPTGQSGKATGGGSGGSVWIATPLIDGSGEINAIGGEGTFVSGGTGGGGAGGRVAVYYGSFGGAGISINVSGGRGGHNEVVDGNTGGLGTGFMCSDAYTFSCISYDGTTLVNSRNGYSVNTTYSLNYSNYINRTPYTSWTNLSVLFNDSASNDSTIGYYDASGLIASKYYQVTDNYVSINGSPSQTDGSGILPQFNVTLSSPHRIHITEYVVPKQNENYRSNQGGYGTLFAGVYNETSISDVQSYVWHSQGNGVIRWDNALDFSIQYIGYDGDLDDDVEFGEMFVAIDSVNAPAFSGVAANITFLNISCDLCNDQKVIYSADFYENLSSILANGQTCGTAGTCSNFVCTNPGGIGDCTFDVTGFSGYAVNGTTELTINDSAEGSSVQNGTDIDFFAYYEDSGVPIANADCNVSFDDGTGPFGMTWNGTGDDNYNYTKVGGFSVPNVHDWNVTCAEGVNPTLFATDNVTVTAPPVAPAASGDVPEFSDYAIILLVLVVVGGFVIMRRRN